MQGPLEQALTHCRRGIVAVAGFSLGINLLMLAVPIYMLQFFDRVLSVSADRIEDERSGESYYLARIELTEDPGPALDGGSLYPGMPAEVMIVTGSRTALDYLLEPLTRTIQRSMREK